MSANFVNAKNLNSLMKSIGSNLQTDVLKTKGLYEKITNNVLKSIDQLNIENNDNGDNYTNRYIDKNYKTVARNTVSLKNNSRISQAIKQRMLNRKYAIDIALTLKIRSNTGKEDTITVSDPSVGLEAKTTTTENVPQFVATVVNRILEVSEETIMPGTDSGYSIVGITGLKVSVLQSPRAGHYIETPFNYKGRVINVNTKKKPNNQDCFYFALVNAALNHQEVIDSLPNKETIMKNRTSMSTISKLFSRHLFNGTHTSIDDIKDIFGSPFELTAENLTQLEVSLNFPINVYISFSANNYEEDKIFYQSRIDPDTTNNILVFIQSDIDTIKPEFHAVYYKYPKELSGKRSKKYRCDKCYFTTNNEKKFNYHVKRCVESLNPEEFVELPSPDKSIIKFREYNLTHKIPRSDYCFLHYTIENTDNKLKIAHCHLTTTNSLGVKVHHKFSAKNADKYKYIFTNDLKANSKVFEEYFSNNNIKYNAEAKIGHIYSIFNIGNKSCKLIDCEYASNYIELTKIQSELFSEFGIDIIQCQTLPGFGYKSFLKYIDNIKVLDNTQEDIYKFIDRVPHFGRFACYNGYYQCPDTHVAMGIDANSLYPTVASKHVLPDGKEFMFIEDPDEINFILNTHYNDKTVKETNYNYLAEFEYNIDKLPEYPLTNNTSGTSVDIIATVIDMISAGYDIKVTKLLKYSTTEKYATFFQKMLKMKERPGYKFIKLVANSTIGKFQTNPSYIRKTIANNPEEFMKCFKDPTLVKSFQPYRYLRLETEEFVDIKSAIIEHYRDDYMCNYPRYLGIIIIAYARYYMYQAYCEIKRRFEDVTLLYSMTDSFYFSFKKPEQPIDTLISNFHVISFKHETPLFNRFVCIRQGVYAWASDTESKVKGSNQSFEDYVNIVNNNESVVDTYTSIVYTPDGPEQVVKERVIKQ